MFYQIIIWVWFGVVFATTASVFKALKLYKTTDPDVGIE